MVKKVFGAVLSVLAVLAVVITSRPDGFRVQRSTSIAAPAAVIYPFLSDFTRWAAWSPWQKLDPAMKSSTAGPPGTVGHAYGWKGNDKVGEGRMTLTSLVPGERVDIELEFFEPWVATNQTSLAIVPEGGGSQVVWTMRGQRDFKMKAASLFMDMDKMVGGDFERGLQELKKLAEAEAARSASTSATSSAPQ
jgi:hypothetical protein